MTNVRWSRRKFLAHVIAGVAAGSLDLRRDTGLSLIPEARAYWQMVFAAIGTALQAYGAFRKSDNGLGQMLGGMIALDKENIRLSREIIASLAQLQKEVDSLKSEMRFALKEFGEDGIRIKTQTMVLNLEVAQRRIADQGSGVLADAGIQQRLREVIRIGTEVASTGSAEYGVGPVAAFCAPVCMGAVAKAQTLLGEGTSATRIEMQTVFIPWLEAILNPAVAGSVASLFASAGAALEVAEKAFPDHIETPLRTQLGDDARRIATLPPGEVVYAHLQCHSYGLQTGTRKGRCLESEERAAGRGEFDMSDCVRYEQIPAYSDRAKTQRWLRVENTATMQAGPQMKVDHIWGDPDFSKTGEVDELRWLRARVAADADLDRCQRTATGKEKEPAKQLAAIPQSEQGNAATAAVEVFKRDSIQRLVDLRSIVWAYLRLLDETTDTLTRVKGIFV